MDFTIERDVLRDALRTVVHSRYDNVALACKGAHVRLTTQDGLVAATTHVAATVSKDGVVTCAAAPIMEVLKSAPKQEMLHVRMMRGKLCIEHGSHKSSFFTAPHEVAFPKPDTSQPCARINAREFGRVVRQTAHALARESDHWSSNLALTGFHATVGDEKLTVVGLDSIRCAEASTPCKGSPEVDAVLAAAGVRLAAEHAQGFPEDAVVTIFSGEQRWHFLFEQAGFACTTVQLPYPDTSKLWGLDATPLVMERSVFVDALAALRKFWAAQTSAVNTKGLIVLQPRHDAGGIDVCLGEDAGGDAQVFVPCSAIPPQMEPIKMAVSYLLDAATAAASDTLSLGYAGQTKALLVTEEPTSDFRALIMPATW